MIFSDNNPAGALLLVSKVLSESKKGYQPEMQPYYTYLLALAYELTGDEVSAVQTYWQLRHDYPGSPYALMARAKLEPIAP